jgi:hypothetical protein
MKTNGSIFIAKTARKRRGKLLTRFSLCSNKMFYSFNVVIHTYLYNVHTLKGSNPEVVVGVPPLPWAHGLPIL